MSITRTLVCAALLAAAVVAAPSAVADPCVGFWTDDFAKGLHIIAGANEVVTFGFTVADPGDGLAFVMWINVPACTSTGPGTGLIGQQASAASSAAPVHIPLP